MVKSEIKFNEAEFNLLVKKYKSYFNKIFHNNKDLANGVMKSLYKKGLLNERTYFNVSFQ